MRSSLASPKRRRLVPGTSRSGATILGGLVGGLTREAAARFSFLLSIPSVFAAGVFELIEARKELLASSRDAVKLAVAARRRGGRRLCHDSVAARLLADAHDVCVHRVSTAARRAAAMASFQRADCFLRPAASFEALAAGCDALPSAE